MKSNKRKLVVCMVVAILVVVFGAFALTACGFFGGSGDSSSYNGNSSSNNSSSGNNSSSSNSSSSSNKKPTSTQILIYIDGVSTAYTAKYGQRVDLGVLTKDGYMLNNITDANGTVYFDYTGKSLTEWSSEYPTSFYASFVPVGNLSYTFDTEWTSSKMVSGVGESSLSYNFKNDVRKQFQSALMGNPSRKVKLTVTYRERGEGRSGNLYFKVRVNGDEVVYSTSTKYIGETYITTTQEVELDASMWINGFKLSWKGEEWYFYHYVKDVTVKIEFV